MLPLHLTTALLTFRMKLLLDQGLPRSAALLLRNAGVEALHVGEIGLASAADISIIERARQEQEVVVTLDADFHALLALSGAAAPSVIRLRMEGLRAEAAAELIRKILAEWSQQLQEGAVLTVQSRRIRFRGLPIL